MILRRFMKHFTDQNWFAVGLDVIVVIVGIFLGLQMTEWNEQRQQMDRVKDTDDKLFARLNPHTVFVENLFTYNIAKNNRSRIAAT